MKTSLSDWDQLLSPACAVPSVWMLCEAVASRVHFTGDCLGKAHVKLPK